MRFLARYGSLMLLCAALFATPARAQGPSPDELLNAVGFDQKLGAQVPLDLAFRDEADQPVRLSDVVRDRPTILSLGYYGCPNICSLARDGLADSLKQIPFDAGVQFDVVMVSIDPRDTTANAALKKADELQRYGRPATADGWHFLTGDETAVKPLTDAVGFRYAYDAAQGQYAHATGIVLLTPQGQVSRYLYGIDYQPRDLRLGLVEASANTIGSPVDQLLLRCYHYDPATGRYDVAIITIIRVAGVITVLLLDGLVALLLRRERSGEQVTG